MGSTYAIYIEGNFDVKFYVESIGDELCPRFTLNQEEAMTFENEEAASGLARLLDQHNPLEFYIDNL